jgi:hypothetical protein
MGVSYGAVGGIGIIVSYDDLKGPKRSIPSCEHEERLGQNFCPKCGLKVSTRQVDDSSRWSDFMEFFYEELDGSMPDGYTTATVDDGILFIGWGLVGDYYSKKTKGRRAIPAFDEVATVLREHLDEYADLVTDESLAFHVYVTAT